MAFALKLLRCFHFCLSFALFALREQRLDQYNAGAEFVIRLLLRMKLLLA